MGDQNGRLDSPLSSQEAEKSASPPSLDRSRESEAFRSNTSSPLLNTEPLPLDDQSHCPYCHKDFRKPRVLDCLHSMCEDCIIAQLDGRRDAQKASDQANRNPTDCELETPKLKERPTPPGVIRCPICAQESHVGNDVRYVHTMLLDYVRLAENEEAVGERRCRACKSEQPAIAVCKQCQSDLCSNCLTAHGVMRMFEGHEVMTYAEMEQRGQRGEVRPVQCPTHSLPYKMLCATCETLCCKVVEVNARVVYTIQSEIEKLADKVEKKWRDSMAEWSAIPDRSASLHEQYEAAKVHVEMAFDDLLKALEEAKTNKLAQLEETRQKQEVAIEDLYRKMNLNEARVSDALRFARNLLSKSNGMELLASRRKVVQQLNNLAHTMPALGIQVELEYQPLSKKQLDTHMNAICGNVIGRMVSANVKETITVQQPATQQSQQAQGDFAQSRSNSTVLPGVAADWGRPLSNGHGSSSDLGAIGVERKKTSTSSTWGGIPPSRITGPGGDAFGWPPSSHPPDLPSPSPPIPLKDVAPPSFTVGGPGVIGQPTTANPAVTSSGGNPLLTGASSTASMIYNNYQWPPSSNPAQAAADLRLFPPMSHPSSVVGANQLKLAQAQAQAAQLQALLLQNNGLGNPNLLMQARLRSLAPGVDPLLALGGLSLAGGPGEGGALLGGGPQRTSPQELLNPTRVPELKIHSVFGTSQQGSSMRELHCPSGFCLSESDDILIADTNNHRIVVCGPPHPWKIGRPGTDDGQLCFPRKVIALKGDVTRYAVLDKGVDGKTRAQLFDQRGEFIKRINMVPLVPRGGIEVSAASCTSSGHLLLVDTSGVVYCIDVDVPRVVFWFDASTHLGEASDVAIYEKNVYITDFKHHCVQVFNTDGQFIRKLGEPSQTPYPIGIDVSKNGDVLVADTHGNHLHVVVFTADGTLQQSFTHNEFRLSRCVGLRVAGSGHVVTLCKHNHTLFVFKPLYIHRGVFCVYISKLQVILFPLYSLSTHKLSRICQNVVLLGMSYSSSAFCCSEAYVLALNSFSGS
ncbi:b-box zinc finger [Ancylostoma duodenale]|uniref:B-box zinc finger n=1 Tax=Ancylostoma duodenale TaxID=51022 RepID=A0A0C2H263_9BILA|nr:b-box zinc finger [Ancylostoma duodenale]